MLRIIHAAYASGHAAVLTQSISQMEARHTEFHAVTCRMLFYKIVMYFYKCFFSIVIVCIDDCKGFFDNILAGKDRLTGSPGFGSSFRLGKAGRKFIYLLKCIGSLYDLCLLYTSRCV